MPSLEFGQFAPDLPIFKNPGLSVARNCIPRGFSYAPQPALSSSSSAMTGACYGAGTAVDTGHNTYIYSADSTKIYSHVSSVPVDVSKSGGYAPAIDSRWEFTQFAHNYFIGTDYDDAVQYITPGGTIFADLIDSTLKPKARHLAVVRNFLVLGNTNDGTDGVRPNRVWWSGINDPTDFDPAASTQCDYEDLSGGGWIMRVVGNREFGLIFTEQNIVRMTYVGPSPIFDFQAIDEKHGTPIPGSVISHGRRVYYISQDGFFFTEGAGESTPIGHERVDRYFWNQFDLANRHRVTAAVDAVKKLIIWSFPGTGHSSGTPNFTLNYNWVDNKWSEGSFDHELLFSTATQGYTIDSLDSYSTDIDSLPYSLDSLAWTGGLGRLGGFDTSHRFGTFTGSNLAATFETGEPSLAAGRLFKTEFIRPMVDGGTVTAAVAGRKRLVDSSSYGTAQSMENDGTIKLQNENRYQKFRVSIAAGGSWNDATGIDIEGSITGER
jgi:hypothetical protein